MVPDGDIIQCTSTPTLAQRVRRRQVEHDVSSPGGPARHEIDRTIGRRRQGEATATASEAYERAAASGQRALAAEPTMTSAV